LDGLQKSQKFYVGVKKKKGPDFTMITSPFIFIFLLSSVDVAIHTPYFPQPILVLLHNEDIINRFAATETSCNLRQPMKRIKRAHHISLSPEVKIMNEYKK
jgi:hypothetical protein